MSAREISDEPRYAETRGINPYIDWVLGPGRSRYFLPGRQNEWMPILVRLKEIGARDFAAGLLFLDDAKRLQQWRESVRVSPLYTEDPVAADAAPYCTAMVRRLFFDLLRSDEKVRAVVENVTLSLPLDSESLAP